MATATQLAVYIEHVGRDGLDPGDYAPKALQLAMQSNDRMLIEAAATQSFGLLARDLAQGHVPPGRRGRYFIATDPLEPGAVADLIDVALERRDIASVLDGLLPHDAQYRDLQAALARLPASAAAERAMLRVNLERLRWLPRELAGTRLVVNIPEYTLRLFQDGKETGAFRVIVGKPSTPTPRFSAQVTGVIFNPSWQVPQSIIAESVGKLVRTRPATARARGYDWNYTSGKLNVTQRPGPLNALGQVKFDMPNPLTVYLHDTPDKTLFDKDTRTFSHGCVRVDHPRDLAAALLGTAGDGREDIDRIVAGGVTRRIALSRPVPVYFVYRTAVADATGSIRYLRDPYRLDEKIAAQLGGAVPPILSSRDSPGCDPA
jgi:murein L,D-transpeptidase YcbB/YkuD